MRLINGNLFDHVGNADAICITTNGFVKDNGQCVMGKGCAKQALNMFQGIDLELGKMLRKYGNAVYRIHCSKDTWVCSFPVKGVSMQFSGNSDHIVKHMKGKFKNGDAVPGWALTADLSIIKTSTQRLVRMSDYFNWKNVIIPRPGCGAGELSWDDDVFPIIDKVIGTDDRFSIITF